MNEKDHVQIISLPEEELEYIGHENDASTITIYVKSMKRQVTCPYCGMVSTRVHSRYARKLQDLPIQDKKVNLILENKKYFCGNDSCKHKTFAEQFGFFEANATKTKRLQEVILRVSLTQSSVSASEYLRRSVADVGKTTICEMLKKERQTV